MDKMELQRFKQDVEKSLRRVIASTHLKGVDFVDEFPSGMSDGLKHRVLERKTSHWYDRQTDRVCIYTPNLMSANLSFVQGEVMSGLIERYGIACMFNSDFQDMGKRLLEESNARMGRHYDSLWDLDTELFDQAVVQKSTLPFSVVVPILAEHFDLKCSEQMLTRTVSNAYYSAYRNLIDKQIAAGDFSHFDDCNIFSLVNKKPMLDFGPTSSTLESMGYPSLHLIGFTDTFKAFFEDHGVKMGPEALKGLSDAIQHPLAVIRSPRGGDVNIVTDIRLDKPGFDRPLFLAFSAYGPEKTVDEKIRFDKENAGKGDRKKYNVSLRPFSITEEKLHHRMLNQDNWIYLKPQNSLDGSSYELIERWKKNGTAFSPAEYKSGFETRFLTVANIAKDFHNPITNEKFLQLYGYKRDPVGKEIERRARLGSELSSLTVPDRQDADSVPVEKLTYLDRTRLPFPKGLFKETEWKKLQAEHISCAHDVMRLGLEKVCELVPTARSINKLCQWLGSNEIWLKDSAIELPVKDSPTPADVIDHFSDCAIRASGKTDKPVLVPRLISGNYITGSDAAHLMYAAWAMRGCDCPVWATESQLDLLGCKPGKAEPVPVMNDGEPTYMYNLQKTDFPKVHPARYEQLMDACKDEIAEHTKRYFSIFLGYLNSGQMEVSDMISHLDSFNTSVRTYADGIKGVSLSDIIGPDGVKELKRQAKTRQMASLFSMARKNIKDKSNGIK